MLLYIHVPFCRSKCAYCAFFSEALPKSSTQLILPSIHDTKEQKTNSADNWDDFDTWDNSKNKSPALNTSAKSIIKEQIWLDTILQEIEMRAEEQKQQKQEKPLVKTIFFGGGTPSLLDPSVIECILRKIHKHFQVDKKAEISLEGNPESLNSKEKIQDYLSVGISRLSVGVQALDDNLLKKLGRVHNIDMASESIFYARTAGCRNINIDLIWGLPSQGLGNWVKQLKSLMQLNVDHISAYSLTIEENTVFYELLKKDDVNLPDEDTLAKMYTRTGEIFQENGYLQYEISNYSRMGFQCKHNIGYWEGEDYLGFGPSATSTIGIKRWTNPYSLELWKQAITTKNIEIDYENLSLQDRVIELIMLRLRTTRGLRVKAVADITGRDFVQDNKKLIDALHKNGLVRLLNGYLRLTHQGFMVSNAILRHLVDNTKKQIENNK